jgi:acetylornithine/succinyldiaminopimelate/putrescine aminotransferase
MAVGKSLGAGVPIAAALFSERVAAAAAFGDHGSTYGGNLLACRAALVFLDELESGLMSHVGRVGTHMEAALRRLQSRHPLIREVRGAGLMWGLDLDRPAAPVVDAAIQQGLLVNRTADTVVRLLPPYIITAEEIDEAIGLLDAALIAAFGGQQR